MSKSLFTVCISFPETINFVYHTWDIKSHKVKHQMQFWCPETDLRLTILLQENTFFSNGFLTHSHLHHAKQQRLFNV